MKKLLFFLVLLLLTLLQISWGQWLSVFGFSVPLVLLALAAGLRFFEPRQILVFAFLSGLFYDLLAEGALGASALLNTVLVGILQVFYQKKAFA